MAVDWKSYIAAFFLFWAGICSISLTAHASENMHRVQWVIDPSSVLSLASTSYLNLILAETAEKQEVYVHVFIIDEPPLNSFNEQIQTTLESWESMHPSYLHFHQKWGYVVINIHTTQSRVGLRARKGYLPDMRQGLYNLESCGVMPALLEGDLEKAIFQGVVGLGTLLKESAPPKSQGIIERLVFLYHTSLAFHLFVLMLFFSLAGCGIAFYLRSSKGLKEVDFEVNRLN